MALKVSWTKRSKTNFDSIVEYLNKEFGEKTAKSFVQRTYIIIESLQTFPEMGSLEIKTKNIRGFLITKHNRLFYRIEDNHIILLSFFNTKKNLKKKKLE